MPDREQADRHEEQRKKDNVASRRDKDDHGDRDADREYPHWFETPFVEEFA